MKKLFKMLLLVFFLFVLYIYTLVIENIPNEFVIFEGESISMRTLLGVKVKNEALKSIETASNNGEKVSEKVGKSTLEVNLFDKIPLKNVEVSVLPKTTVIPVGNIAGVKLYTNGVLVVGMSEIEGDDNKKYKPYENTGIKEGDRIIKINDTQIDSTDELVETVNLSQGEQIKIEYIHETKTKECSMNIN